MGLSRSVGTALFICFLIREAPPSKVPQSVSVIEQICGIIEQNLKVFYNVHIEKPRKMRK